MKKEVAQLKQTSGASASELGKQLGDAQKQLASLQTEKETWTLEKAALEDRLKKGTSTVESTSIALTKESEAAKRIKELEDERDDLVKKLAEANKDLEGKRGKVFTAKIDELSGQIATLRSRLEVFEARRVPYTAEELALFKKAEAPLASADPKTGKKSLKDLPSGSAPLVAEAQRYFAAGEFEKAEEKYAEILKKDEENVYTLGNLASIQLERGNLEEAEKTIRKAIALDPKDAFSLAMLGRIKYQQGKYDESLDALSNAAQLDPRSAEIQNDLGITLGQKGMRGPAETALRKAIQLSPGYGSAHNNLAVIYVSQDPPLVELARWHYQKALASGHGHNSDLEKMLETRAAASASR